MAAMIFKCPNCGGDLRFAPEKQRFQCEYCLSEFSQEQMEQSSVQIEEMEQSIREEDFLREKAEEENSDIVSKEERSVMYSCPNCGAEIVTDETTAATFCYYCHNPVVLSGRMQGAYHPDGVIPFAMDREKAREIFEQWIARKKYLPKAFYAPEQLEKMAGVYFPYWLYDCEVEGELEGEGRTQKLWTEGNLQFTRTEKYDINRKGTMEIHNLTRNALSKGNRKLVEGVMPFDMTQMQAFQMGYLSGFLAENRDMEKEQFAQEVGAEVSAFAEQSLKSSVSGYDSVQYRKKETRVCESHWRYVLMPVWTMTYKDPKTDKVYYFACNGQTGKVCGELPVDPGRLMGLFLSCFIPVLIVLLVIGYWI